MKEGKVFLNPRLVALAILVAGIFLFAAFVIADDNLPTSATVTDDAPSIDAITLNGGSNITLTENTSTIATTTVTVSDTNGCNTITSVEAKLYLASTSNSGTTCSASDTNCYEEFIACTATTTGSGTCDGGTDTAVDYDCSFRLWYVANPTDSGSPWESDIWSVAATTSDGTSTTTATNTSETIEVNTLQALSVTASINYGSVEVGQDTGTTDQTITVTNTGNAASDTEISGDTFCSDYPTCSGNTFTYDQQKFDLTASVDYTSKTYTIAATTSPATIDTALAKPTATTSAVTDDTYWGINIPNGTAVDSFSSQNTFTAVATGRWDISTATYLQSTSTSDAGGEFAAQGVFFRSDGTKMYITGQGEAEVDEYNLSGAWDVSTASYAQSTTTNSAGAGESFPKGIFFKSDGAKMYVTGQSDSEVDEYDLSAAWDVSTASYVQSTTTTSLPEEVSFKADGTKMYVADNSNNEIDEYTLSSAWDVSMASYNQSTSTFTVVLEGQPNGLFFKPDGTKMYVAGNDQNEIHEYNLSSAWDVSTASYVQSTATDGAGAGETTPTGVFFKPDGTKMYVVGDADEVDEYNLGN